MIETDETAAEAGSMPGERRRTIRCNKGLAVSVGRTAGGVVLQFYGPVRTTFTMSVERARALIGAIGEAIEL